MGQQTGSKLGKEDFQFKMADQKDVRSSAVRTPKSKLAVEQPSTGFWKLPKTPMSKDKEATVRL